MPQTAQPVLHGSASKRVLGVGLRGIAAGASLFVLDQHDGLGHHGASEASHDGPLGVRRLTTATDHHVLRTRAAILIVMT